ncbi:Hypothetical predicted protein [Octopus vulgaris]|uniref:Uncharacterized protein n=1 Tax=Octopus vulgaris TaxID=6645 RepID=A0AA36B2E2_OCTVU|nr:Hypothetical predicted protein [Octopus vulgaris]
MSEMRCSSENKHRIALVVVVIFNPSQAKPSRLLQCSHCVDFGPVAVYSRPNGAQSELWSPLRRLWAGSS